jgi:hypothetical protein
LYLAAESVSVARANVRPVYDVSGTLKTSFQRVEHGSPLFREIGQHCACIFGQEYVHRASLDSLKRAISQGRVNS